MKAILIILPFLIFSLYDTFSQNPIIRDQFSADPTARVFDGKIYVYPSHDIVAKEGQGRPNWFCMEDYHVFSSEDLTNWTDHGMIVSQTKVPWANPQAYSMWAPDCIYRNEKYYFYFPTIPKDSTFGRGFTIGVAISASPEGPFIPESRPIDGVHGIDPNLFIDNDGQAYLYWSQGNIYGAKLKENMTELDSDPVIIGELPEKGLKEGPFLFERNGLYYITFPHVQNKIERLEYAIGNNPMGPFKITGVIMDESASGCWTNHQSIVKYKNQWYLFYHDMDLSPKFDKNRSIRVDSLFFNEDGTIRKVIPTFRGVGLTSADTEIQIDRYSRISKDGVAVSFNDTLNTFSGWKTLFYEQDAWLAYSSVDFGSKKFKKVEIKALSKKGSTLQIRSDAIDGPVVAEISIQKGTSWNFLDGKTSNLLSGVHSLFLVLTNDHPVEVDWIKFKE